MTTTYYVGSEKTIAVQFYNASNAAADPTTVTFKFQSPDKVVTIYTYPTNPELVKESTGRYHVILLFTQSQTWKWRFDGTGAVKAAKEGEIFVRPSWVP